MDRSARIARSSRRWRTAGILAFCIGAFLLYQKIYYASRDFYEENYNTFSTEMVDIPMDDADVERIDQAMKLMEQESYWDAVTELEELKKQNPSATQIGEWYKILCMIGLEEKEKAIKLLQYYLEQPEFNFQKEKAALLLKEY